MPLSWAATRPSKLSLVWRGWGGLGVEVKMLTSIFMFWQWPWTSSSLLLTCQRLTSRL